MPNIKLYYLSQSDFNAKVKNAKMPLQQVQIYRALAKIGKPTRGVDVIDKAVKEEGLITRQDYAVLAAWYFSPKRRPDCIRLGEPTVVEEDLADRITRLTAELEAKAKELQDAEDEWLKQVEAEQDEEKEAEGENEEPGDEDPNDAAVNEKARQEIAEAEAEEPRSSDIEHDAA